MARSRLELHRLLVVLQKTTPSLLTENPTYNDFMKVFLERSGAILDQSSPEDLSWVQREIEVVLKENGPNRVTNATGMP